MVRIRHSRGPGRESTVRALFIAVIILTAVSGCAELWAVHTYGSLDPLVVPAKINVFGRDYRAGDGGPSTRAKILAAYAGDQVDILEPAVGAWPFVPPWVRSVTGYDTPTSVWLHVGPDAYLQFGLVGGP